MRFISRLPRPAVLVLGLILCFAAVQLGRACPGPCGAGRAQPERTTPKAAPKRCHQKQRHSARQWLQQHGQIRSPAGGRGAAASGGGTGAGRRHAAHRPAGADGHLAGRHHPGTIPVRLAVASGAAFPLSQGRSPEGHDRRAVADRHPDAAAADRAWRPISSWCANPAARRSPLRCAASPFPLPAAICWDSSVPLFCLTAWADRQPAGAVAVPGHRAFHFLHQDRGDGGARNEFHAPQSGPDHRRHRHHGRHLRLGDHRHHLRHRGRGRRWLGSGRHRLARTWPRP